MDPLPIQTMKAEYIVLWMKTLEVMLHWSKDRVLAWAKQYQQGLDGHDLWFYHEDPLHYIIPLLIPDQLKLRLQPTELYQLQDQLRQALGAASSPLLPEALTAAQQQLPLEQWLPLFSSYSQEAVARGEWLSATNMDRYDWQAARLRVEQVLRQYGVVLPVT